MDSKLNSVSIFLCIGILFAGTADARMSPALLGGTVAGAGACSASYGNELATTQNATDVGATEADTTTGWGSSGLATFSSLATAPNTGTYHLSAIADTSGDTLYRVLSGLSTSTVYRLSVYGRHNGTGGAWTCGIYRLASAGLGTGMISIATAETSYKELEYFFLWNSSQDNFICTENTAGNDGGIYLDTYSLTAATLCYGSELHTSANAASISNEADAITGLSAIGSATLASTTNGTPPDGTYQISATPAADGDGFSFDLNTILSAGTKYLLRFKSKVMTSGQSWTCHVGSATNSTTNQMYVSSTSSEEFGFAFVHSATSTRYFSCREAGASNTDGVYFDAFSVKEITAE